MHQVDPELVAGRQEQRDDDQNDRRRVKHAAEQQEQHIDADQEGQRGNIESDQGLGDDVGDVFRRHHIVEDQRAADHQPDGCGRPGAFDQNAVERAERQRLVEQACQQQRIGRRDCRSLGRCGDAAVDSVKQDGRHQQGREGIGCMPRQIPERNRLLDRKVAARRNDGVHHHQNRAHEQSRHDAAQKQEADRCV